MALVMISHDLGVVSQVCERILVMYAGRIAERGTRRQFLESPRHPYTRSFLDSIPEVDRKRDLVSIPGSPPDLSNPPSGCRFHPRCPQADAGLCDGDPPPTVDFGDGHTADCYAYTDVYDGPADYDADGVVLDPVRSADGGVDGDADDVEADDADDEAGGRR